MDREGYDEVIHMINTTLEGLYIPTSEFFDFGIYKISVRQGSLSVIDVWENEYKQDALDPFRLDQNEDWNRRQYYRNKRKQNASKFMDNFYLYLSFMNDVRKENPKLYFELVNKVPRFLDVNHVAIYKNYADLGRAEKIDRDLIHEMVIYYDIYNSKK